MRASRLHRHKTLHDPQLESRLLHVVVQAMADASGEGGGGGGRGGGSLEVGEVEMQLLHGTLDRKLEALRLSEVDDEAALSAEPPDGVTATAVGERRRYYVACYRDGMREVLREAIEWAEGLLEGAVE